MSHPDTGRGLGAFVLAILGGALAFAVIAPAAMRAEVASGGIACMFLELTGVPCPFCGMTRATLSLGAGDVGAALRYHPLAPLVLGLTAWGAIGLLRGRLRGIGGRPARATHVAWLVAAIWAVKLAATVVG